MKWNLLRIVNNWIIKISINKIIMVWSMIILKYGGGGYIEFFFGFRIYFFIRGVNYSYLYFFVGFYCIFVR